MCASIHWKRIREQSCKKFAKDAGTEEHGNVPLEGNLTSWMLNAIRLCWSLVLACAFGSRGGESLGDFGKHRPYIEGTLASR